jgi:hypothetical protein
MMVLWAATSNNSKVNVNKFFAFVTADYLHDCFLTSKMGSAKLVLLSGSTLRMSRNIPLEAGRGVIFTPMSISGGGEMLLCQFDGDTIALKGHSFLGVMGESGVGMLILRGSMKEILMNDDE